MGLFLSFDPVFRDWYTLIAQNACMKHFACCCIFETGKRSLIDAARLCVFVDDEGVSYLELRGVVGGQSRYTLSRAVGADEYGRMWSDPSGKEDVAVIRVRAFYAVYVLC